MYQYAKLLGRMKEYGYTQGALAQKVGCAPSTLNLKLHNRADFGQGEIDAICSCLQIPSQEIGQYFFTKAEPGGR